MSNDFDNRKVEGKKLSEILDVAHKLMLGSKKLEIRKSYTHDVHGGSLTGIITEEKTTYRIVDAL